MTAKPKPRTLASRPTALAAPLLADVRELILAAREAVSCTVDAGFVTLYWHVGRRIHQDILKEKRAEWHEDCVRIGGTIECGTRPWVQ